MEIDLWGLVDVLIVVVCLAKIVGRIRVGMLVNNVQFEVCSSVMSVEVCVML